MNTVSKGSTTSTYKTAALVSATIASHFTKHITEAKNAGDVELASQPSKEVIEAIIDAGFWTSLRKEEGHSPRISFAYVSPEQSGHPIIFQKRLSLNPKVLIKLAPGIENQGIHLGIWQDESGLYAWGTTRELPGFCFVLETVEPGLLIVKHRRYKGFGKFVNVAMLNGDEIKIVDEQSGSIPDCPALLSSLLGLKSNSPWNDSVNVLIQLSISMRSHKRGGTLLVVPAFNNEWNDSIVHPISYSVVQTSSALFDLMKHDKNIKEQSAWQSELNREVDNIAGLTAVDGATLINDEYKVLAFGAKIHRSEKSTFIEKVMFTEPIVGGEALIIHPTKIGGTRHLSAAQFVFDQRDAIALVASQDGRFTVFGWSPCDEMVHAHAIDILLL